MSVIKGYPEKFRKVDVLTKDQYVTAEPVRENQIGSSVVAHTYVTAIGTDTVEASSTTEILNLTAHDAKVGDVIRFTSGALDGQEVKVLGITTDTVILAEVLSADPSTLTVQILRHKYPVVNADGTISVSLSINTEYAEDSAHTTGDEGTYVLAVRQDSLAASTDTDGDYGSIKTNANGEIYCVDSGAIALLTTIDADTSTIAADTTSIDGKITACDTGAVVIASSALPSGASTSANQVTANSSLADIKTSVEIIDNAIDGTEMQVDIVAPLPAGTNTIGAVTFANPSPVDFLDSGLVDSSSSNITVAGLSVVASLASDCTELEIVEDIGAFMAITDGSDNILAYLPLGGGRVKLSISSGTALKLASLTGASITSGSIAINFLG